MIDLYFVNKMIFLKHSSSKFCLFQNSNSKQKRKLILKAPNRRFNNEFVKFALHKGFS